MTEEEFDKEVPKKEQNWGTFGRMHDAVMEATWNTTRSDLTLKQCKNLFLLLPEHIQETAIQWGFNDTCFGDDVYTFAERNTEILKGL